jgi:hypothetical protein
LAATVVMSRSAPASVPDGNISPYLATVCSADRRWVTLIGDGVLWR